MQGVAEAQSLQSPDKRPPMPAIVSARIVYAVRLCVSRQTACPVRWLQMNADAGVEIEAGRLDHLPDCENAKPRHHSSARRLGRRHAQGCRELLDRCPSRNSLVLKALRGRSHQGNAHDANSGAQGTCPPTKSTLRRTQLTAAIGGEGQGQHGVHGLVPSDSQEASHVHFASRRDLQEPP